jgi:hypothetical protein
MSLSRIQQKNEPQLNMHVQPSRTHISKFGILEALGIFPRNNLQSLKFMFWKFYQEKEEIN